NEEGYLIATDEWDHDVAADLAKEEDIDLSNTHYAVLEFLRNKAKSGDTITIRSVGKSGIIDIKQFYQLFPGGPLKKASKIAGIQKPSSCV
nr:TusE/DsrC/DsvC family sulfur relay protein [Bacteroidota bacterium]